MLTTDRIHQYQWLCSDHIMNNSHCGLFLDMGLGKTISTLTAINKLIYEELDISSVLVIGTKRVAESVWDQECESWEHTQNLKVSKIIGNTKQRVQAIRKKADIYVISRDNISWLCGQYGGNMLPFDMLVIDESSSFKNSNSIRFKSLKKVQPSFKRVVILTGTPAPNTLIDLWSQIYLLDRGERLHKFITKFRTQYFTKSYNGFSYDLRSKDCEKTIHDKISDICISMKSKDYLDLPDTIENIVKIKMPNDIQQKYDDFAQEQVLNLFNDGQEISATNAAALSNKLLQFSNGAVYDENKNYHVVHDLKIQATKEIIEEANGKPVLIAWSFRHDMYRLKEALKEYKPRELKNNKDIKDWNDKKIHVLLMHPASGGHGLNLQKGGNNIIWFGQTWSLEFLKQLNARLARQGQEEVVTIHKLVCVNTMDMKVIKSQESKDKTQESLLKAVKAYVDRYGK